jgi:hypothetical protein
MRSSHVCGRTLATSLIAFGIGLAALPVASADPNDDAQTDTPAPGPSVPPTGPITLSTNAGPLPTDDPTSTACHQFASALNVAAVGYEDFAYATAGGGNYVNYGDPSVVSSNIAGRSGLKEAAAAAATLAATPGLPGDIAGPMGSWAAHAAQLYLLMTVGGGGDALNSTAVDLNNDGRNAQMACAAAGVRFR